MANKEIKVKELEEMSSNEILFQLKQFEADYDALKIKMLKDFDSMVELEKKYQRANEIILNRLNKN